MATPVAEIIDVGALLSVVAASLLAGAGLTVAFSLVIVSSTRAAERRREGGRLAPLLLGLLAALAALACVGLIAFGLLEMVRK